jgi:hypothetical protein
MIYKIKHKPTGLYYAPSKGNGSNLSPTGKIYQGNPKIWADDCVRIGMWIGDKPTKFQQIVMDYFEVQPTDDGCINKYFHGQANNWEIEEIK